MAKGDAVVIFNVSDIRSDAFLIATDGIRSVHLPLLTFDTIKSCANLFLKAISKQDTVRQIQATRNINSVLELLWNGAVKTMLDELGFTISWSAVAPSVVDWK